MAFIPFRDLGSKGIVRDTSPLLLDGSTFTNGRNVTFDNDSVSSTLGHTELFDTSTSLQFVEWWPRPTTPAYVYSNATTPTLIFPDGSTDSLVRSGVTYNSNGRWQGSLFNAGYTLIMNNTIDPPQYITQRLEGSSNPDQVDLQELPGWPSGLSAGVVRSHGNVLIAGNLRDASGATVTRLPGTIRISSRAAPGDIPASWTVDPSVTITADEFELSSTSEVLELVDLKGYILAFTGNSIHRIQIPTSATDPTQVQTLNTGRGALGTDCAVEVEGRVFVVDRDDIYYTSGGGYIKSIADHKIRDYFFNNLNDSFHDRVFIRNNIPTDEVWIYYPTLTSTDGRCNEVLKYNHRNNTWSIQDAPNVTSATLGPSISNNAYNERDEHIVFTGYSRIADTSTSDRIHLGNTGTTFNGDPINTSIEHEKLALSEVNATDEVDNFYPLLESDHDVTFTFIETHTPQETVDFNSSAAETRIYNITDDYKIEPRTNGRFFSWRMSSSNPWILSGYTIETEPNDGR